MGTDIHAVFQARKDDKWVDVPSTWEQGRHYLLFAWLANIRNGFGFAGVPTFNAIKPILSESNGLPADFEMVDECYHPTMIEAIDPRDREYIDDVDKLPDGRVRLYMYGHTPCHLSLDQILEADRPAMLNYQGVVPRSFYDSWDGMTSPETWVGDITGGQIHVEDRTTVNANNRKAAAPLPNGCTHVRIRFDTPDGLDYFVDEIRRLREEHGADTRLVFGFDS